MDSDANEETSYRRNQTKRHQSAEKKPHLVGGFNPSEEY